MMPLLPEAAAWLGVNAHALPCPPVVPLLPNAAHWAGTHETLHHMPFGSAQGGPQRARQCMLRGDSLELFKGFCFHIDRSATSRGVGGGCARPRRAQC